MLQIIGWLMCLYLVVKACELLSMDRNEQRFSRPVATLGAVIAILGAAAFFFLINEQARQSTAAQDQAQEQMNATMSNLNQ